MKVVAEAIHRHSGRRTGPFVRVSLASLSPSVIESELFGHGKGAFTGAAEDRQGLFELAENGTVFLDEIGETPPEIQVKLLRVLESHSFARVGTSHQRTTNSRLIAATNRDLETMIVENKFREDLYHRLKVFLIELPPLRSHVEDLRPLVEYFIGLHPNSTKPDVTDEFWNAVHQRVWHGNIRELRNAIDHAVVLSRGGPLMPEHLPLLKANPSGSEPEEQLTVAIAEWVQSKVSEGGNDDLTDLYRSFLQIADAALLSKVLVHTQNNRSAAAKLLGLDRATLRAKLESAAPV